MKRFRQRKAFTIVEMVIVIAVIAILATVLVPTFGGIIQKANHSADTQFAASLNVQLAMWQVDNGEIQNESDLRKAIDEYYGDGFYSDLAPKSAPQGYYYWYDYVNGVVHLETIEGATALAEELNLAANDSSEQFMSNKFDAEGNPVPQNSNRNDKKFSPASLRTDLVDGFYLMGGKGEEGDLVDIVSKFETLGMAEDSNGAGQDYEDVITALGNPGEGTIEKVLLEKIKTTAIITEVGAFRFADIASVTNVYIPLNVKELTNTKIYIYDASTGKATDGAPVNGVAGGDENTDIVRGGVRFELPQGVIVDNYGLYGLGTPSAEVDSTGMWKHYPTVVAYDNDLNKVFKGFPVNCVIETPDGSRYAVRDNEYAKLPLAIADNNEVFEADGTFGEGTISDDVVLGIDFTSETNKTFYDEENKILYIAYDISDKNVKLTATGGVPASKVTWAVKDGSTNLLSVNKGLVTIEKLPEVKTNPIYSEMITASVTTESGTTKTAEITVYVVRPTKATGMLGGQTLSIPSGSNNKIGLTYVDNEVYTFDFTKPSLGHNAQEVVSNGAITLDDCTFSVTAGEGSIFTVDNDAKTLTVNPDVLSPVAANNVQNITVTYTGADGTVYLTQTFEVTVTDSSSVGLDYNKIVDNKCNNGECQDKENCDHNDIIIGGTYLFRVGNSNAVKLSALFCEAKEGRNVVVNGITVYNVTNITEGQGVPMGTTGDFNVTVANNASDWKLSTLKFGGTGIAKIVVATAQGDITLFVEVVDGKNITSASELATNTNNILLADIDLEDYANNYFNLSGTDKKPVTLFGNGFTFDVRDGRINQKGVITLSYANLDNIKIIGQPYTIFALSGVSNDYYGSTVYISNGTASTITNSYISNCRSPIRVEGDLVLEDSVLDGGCYANMIIYQGEVTLDGVTTINQARESNLNRVGLGIIFDPDASEGNASIKVINNGLTQYNWITDDEPNLPEYKIMGVDIIGEMIKKMFSDEFASYHHTLSGTTYVNTGIISFSPNIGADDIIVVAPYQGVATTAAGRNGYVASVLSTGNFKLSASDLVYREQDYNWVPKGQSPVIPTFTWSNYSSGEAEITFNEGETYEFDPHVLTAKKHNQNLSVTVKMGDSVIGAGQKINFTESGTYTITYIIKDPYVYDLNGDKQAATVYTKTVTVTTNAVKQEIKAPVFTFKDRSGNTYECEEVTIKVDGTDRTYMVPKGVTSADKVNIGATKQGSTIIYVPIVESYHETDAFKSLYRYYPIFSGVTIQNYTVAGSDTPSVTYSTSTNKNQYNQGAWKAPVTFGAIDGLTQVTAMKGNNGDMTLDYNNSYGGMHLKSTGVNATEGADGVENNVKEGYGYIEYSFTAGNDKTYYFRIGYHCPKGETKGSGCVTPETLVTLADGTQKEIQYVTESDLLMVWNHFTGEYTTVPAAIIFNHGYDYNTVIKLNFSDGTQVKMINIHQFLDADLKQYVSINASNVADYVGHNFVKQDGDGYTTVTLESYEVSEEYIEAYGIISALHYNILVEGMFSTDFMQKDCDLFNYFTIGEGMVYDAQQMQEDIEQYGLYTYEDFADYLTYEQFVGFNVQYFKIAVGRGLYTYEGILNLIDEYLNA